ncbi:MAG: hypothetical protein ACXW30_04130 [Micavibrio sp.]
MTADMTLTEYTVGTARKGWFPNLPVLIVSGCLLFNFFLCFIHTAGINISETYVILCELVLVSLAAAYGFYRPDRERYFWIITLMTQFVLLSLLSVIRDEIIIKALRDVMIMPVFIALGLASARINFTRPLLWLSAFIGAIALFEAFSLGIFTEYFNVRDYYIAKGYDADSFQYMGDDVFISGIRPGGRFFPFPFEIHRISSVFLEPVSLGFYAFISGLYFIAMKDSLPRGQVLLAIFVTLLLIWLGDARMAFASLVLVMAFRPVFARLDHRLSVLIFPAALIFGLFVVESGLFNLQGEGLGARLLWTFERLRDTEDGQFFGARPYDTEMVDSGFLYLLGGQGILGFLLYWLPPILFKGRFSKASRIYWFGASIFLTSGLMISNAIFTIKTASLLWFCFGYIMARTKEEKTS